MNDVAPLSESTLTYAPISNMASSNVHVHITEHVTTASAVLSTATIVTSTFPHTSVIFSPQQKGPKTRSSTGSQVKSTHMRVKVSPEKTVPEITKAKQDVVLSRPKKTPIPQVPSSTTSISSSNISPNIINLHNVENIDEWLRSSNNVYAGRMVENDALKDEECKWGNPFRLRDYESREEVVDLYRANVVKDKKLMTGIDDLHGKVLGCWCSPCRCHTEVLHELAGNTPRYEGESSTTNAHASSPTSSSPSSNTEGETSPSTCVHVASVIPSVPPTYVHAASSTTTASPTYVHAASSTTSSPSTYVHAASSTPSSSSPTGDPLTSLLAASSTPSSSSTYVNAASPTPSSSSPTGDPLTSPLAASSTPSSSSPTGDPLMPPSETLDIQSLAERLNGVESQVFFQTKHIGLQKDRIEELEERISCLEGDLIQTKAHLSVRDSVIEALRGEVQRLQQYTRRYSVTVVGIDKGRNENHENPEVLHEKVRQLITDVNSTTTEQDVDKFHRNGPLTNGKDQEIIIRFKSHSAKEAFYKARKNLLPSRKDVKIRPSLSMSQLNLLRDAQSVLEDLSLDKEIVNPVEFVFANIHGLIQAKLKRKFRGSPFVSFNSIPDFVRKVQEAQVLRDADSAYEEVYSKWTDKSSRSKSVHQSRSRASDESDDMGFGVFD